MRLLPPLLLLLSLLSPASATFKRRRVVDLVFTTSVLKAEWDELLPAMAKQFAVQTHTVDTTDCGDVAKGLVRGEDDFLVLMSISGVKCPKDVCKKNYANVVLPLGNRSGLTVAYDCSNKTTLESNWTSVAKKVRMQQKDIVLETAPDKYISEREGKLPRSIVAGFCVMGLVIVGMMLLMVFLNVEHAKEVKTLKGGGTEEKGKKPGDGPKLETKTDKSGKSEKSSK